MAISVPCRITPTGDEPILIRGMVPTFGHYTEAYRFLDENGYATNWAAAGELAIVNECYSRRVAIDRFGDRLVPYEQLSGHKTQA